MACNRLFLAKLLIASLTVAGAVQSTRALAQAEFQENKGQWPNVVLYRGAIPGGYLFLRKDGFTYSLYNQADVQRIDDFYHGDPHLIDSFKRLFPQGPIHQSNGIRPQEGIGSSGLPLFHIHAQDYQMNFLGANPDPVITPDHPSQARYNYLIGNDTATWGRNVKAYGAVSYQGLYPHIDARVYVQNGQLQYDLIVQPGGNPDAITLGYTGAESLKLEHGHLRIHTTVGDVIEVKPYAFQSIQGRQVEVPCTYQLSGNVLRFKVAGSYQPEYPLIIDPTFVFCTFSGSYADNWGYTATYDRQGNFYMGGIVFASTAAYPVTPGAYQTTFGGGYTNARNGESGFDISISKFDPKGFKLIYATYLGGYGNEQPHSLITDQKEDLIISGRTNSPNYPGTRVGKGGDEDIILSELSPDGSSLVGSLIIGGSKPDGVNIADKYTPVNNQYVYTLRRFYGDDARSEVNIDPQGNIILASATQSDADFPVTSGVFQPKYGGGFQDGVMLKCTPDLSRVIWSSYLGGNGDDAAYVINFSSRGTIYVAGGTTSTDFTSGRSTGTEIQPNNGGGVDGYIAEVSSDGSRMLQSTYLGTPAADQIYGLQLDADGNVYVGGTTEGTWPIVNGTYPGVVVDGKQFIEKLKPDLSGPPIYSTVFGTGSSTSYSLPNISPTAFLVDRCQNVYMAGWGGTIFPQAPSVYPTSGTLGLPIVNPFLRLPQDGNDFYFFVLKRNATQILFAQNYGQYGGFTDHVDGGTSRFDPQGVIYEAICANCDGGARFPTGPPGIYSPYNKSRGGCNEAGLKVAFNLDGVRGGIQTRDYRRVYCNTDSISLVDTLEVVRPAQSWNWAVFKTWDSTQVNAGNQVINVTQDSTNTQSPGEFKTLIQSKGYYIVRLIKFNPNDCIDHDTTYLRLKVGDVPAHLKYRLTKLAPCTLYQYQVDNLSTNAINEPFLPDAFVWNFGDKTGDHTGEPMSFTYRFPGQGNYTVSLQLVDTADFCNAPQDTSSILSISLQLKAGIQAPDTVCQGTPVMLSNASLGGTNYTWYIRHPDGSVDSVHENDLSPLPYTFNSSGAYQVRLVAYDKVCDLPPDTADQTVLVYPFPTAAFSYSPMNPVNQTIQFMNRSRSHFSGVDDSLFYSWEFGDGSLSTKTNPQYQYAKTGTYQVYLQVVNKAGCMDTVSTMISETIYPKMDMPKAFTPNGDGLNDYVAPRAFGVVSLSFSIFNRWGQEVYHSNDPSITYLDNAGWDGRFQGKPQPMDSYAYTLHVRFSDGTQATKQGSITLIR